MQVRNTKRTVSDALHSKSGSAPASDFTQAVAFSAHGTFVKNFSMVFRKKLATLQLTSSCQMLRNVVHANFDFTQAVAFSTHGSFVKNFSMVDRKILAYIATDQQLSDVEKCCTC